MTEPRRSHPCRQCGACCIAPDIAALAKPLGQRCMHLGSDNLCSIYSQRPDICRRYQSDDLCDIISAPTLDERVQNYLAVFGLERA
jgi:Fe-S-cluster containining protein